jgi:hypothetical protein
MENTPVVYLTMYLGDKLPKWYIDSSKKHKIENGYNGSVTSKKYSSIFKSEQKSNKHLFKTKIISYHKTTQESLDEELRLQKLHNVVKNPKYINMSYCQRNGFHGGDTSEFIDYDNPTMRKRLSEAGKDKSNSHYGKKWYNDGLKNYLKYPKDSMGLNKGRI